MSDDAQEPGESPGVDTGDADDTGDAGDARGAGETGDTGDAGDIQDRLAGRPPGFDDDDPYADGLEGYPAWWRENAEAFRDHGMRPYRPPQFADGTLVPELVSRLEAELGVDIRIRKHISADAETAWTLVVDGRAVETLERVRNDEGRSVYACAGGEVETLVRQATDP